MLLVMVLYGAYTVLDVVSQFVEQFLFTVLTILVLVKTFIKMICVSMLLSFWDRFITVVWNPETSSHL